MEDDFIPDYEIGPDIEDPPSPPKIQGATNTKKGKTYPICLAKFTHVKRHVMKDHLPWYATPETCCPTCKINFGQKHFLEKHNEETHNNNQSKNSLDKFWVDFMFCLLLKLIQILKLENFENLFKFVNTDTRFQCCKGAVFQIEDKLWGKKFLKAKFPGEEMSDSPYPVTDAASLLHWKILSILIDLTNCVDLLIKIYKRYVVWIIGSSLVYWSKSRAIDLRIGNLEFDQDFVEICWNGIRGMKWESFLETVLVEFCKSKFPNPDFIIIQLGSKDIKFSCSKKVLTKMQGDLEYIRKHFQVYNIFFSELLCRLSWRGLRWEEGEKQRNLVNDGMRSFLCKDNCIQHPRIIRKSYFFRDDGVH